ncbi:unnamed protein product [Boreogadus saida]
MAHNTSGSLTCLVFPHKTVVGVISAIEKELGGRNFGFDSLKNMNRNMEEKGIVAHNCLPLEPRCPVVPRRCPLPAAEAMVPKLCPLPRQWSLGSGQRCLYGRQSRATISSFNMWKKLFHMFSLLLIDVEVKEPETSENPMQLFEIHNIVWSYRYRNGAFGESSMCDWLIVAVTAQRLNFGNVFKLC